MNAIQYVKNAGKSLGYATIDVLKSYNPGIIASATQVKEFSSEVYQSIKDFNSNLRNANTEDGIVGQAKDAAKDILKSVKEDIASGNWYNKQRINANQEAMFNEMMGLDGEDFNFDFDDDFGDFNDDDLESSTKQEISAEKQTAREIVGSVDAIAAKSVAAISNASVKSAEYIATTQERSARALYNLNEKAFGTITKGIGSMTASLNVMQSLAEPLTTHMQNAATYYTKSTEFQNKALDLLTKIEQGINPQDSKSKYSSSKRKITPDDLVTDGTLDLKNYVQFISENVKESMETVTALLDMFGGIKGAGKMAAGSPLSMVLTSAVEKALPKALKNSMKDFNEMFEGAVYTFLGGLKNKKLPGILDIFKDIFVPDFTFKDSFNVNKFPKGPMKWDGIARHALTQIIPLQLSKIVTALTGEDRTMFDYRTGRWRKLKNARGEVKQKIKYNATSNDLNYEAKRVIREQQNKKNISQAQANKFESEIDELMYNIMTSNDTEKYLKIFDPKTSDNDMKELAKKFGNVDVNTLKLLRRVVIANERLGKRSLKTQFTGSMVRGRVNANRVMADIAEEGGYTTHAYNGGYEEGEDEKPNSEGTKGFLGKSTDTYGHDIFYYLQGIYLSANHVSSNLEYLASGGIIGGVDTTPENLKDKKNKKKNKPKKITNFNPRGTIAHNTNTNAGTEKINEASDENAGDIMKDLNKAINAVSSDIDRKYSTKELENYSRRKANFLKIKGNNENSWKISTGYDEKLEEQMEREDRNRGIFGGIKENLANSKLNPIFKSISKMFDKIGKVLEAPANAMTGFYNSMSTSINNALYGENQKGGIFDWIKSAIKDFRGTMATILETLADKFKGSLKNNLLGEKDENGNYDNTKFFGRMYNETKGTLKSAGKKIKSDLGFGGSGSGVGELILAGGKSKSRRKAVKKKNKEKIKQQAAAAQQETPVQEINPDAVEDTVEETEGDATNKRSPFLDFWYQGGKTLFEGMKTVGEKLFGKDPNKELSETQKKLKKASDSLFEGLKDDGALGGIGAGAILGTGTSILTGGLINPLLGAGLGVVVGFINKSKTAQTLLFGEEGKQTDMQKKMQEVITKNIPGIAEGAGIGGTAGLFLGSPILGSIIGGTIGFVSSSEKAKKFLFGDEEHDTGLISKELQKKIKTALPNIGAGAIAGLIAGPFGSVAANIVLGSALGFASSTDGFKNWLFGEEKDGKREGGLLGKLREDIADPIVGIFQKLGNEMKHGFRNLTKGLKSSISKIFAKAFGGLKDKVKESRTLSKVLGFGKKIIEAPINLISKPLKGINRGLEKRALRKGYGLRGKDGEFVDAFTRQQMAANAGYKDYTGSIGSMYDEFLAGANDEEIKAMATNYENYKKKGDLSDLLNEQTRSTMRFNKELDKAGDAVDREAINKAIENGDFTTAKKLAMLGGKDLFDSVNNLRATSKRYETTKQLFDNMKNTFGDKGFDIDDFGDLLKQEHEARSKLLESPEALKEREERRNHIITEVIPNRIGDIATILMHIYQRSPIDENSDLFNRIENYGAEDGVFKDVLDRKNKAQNEKTKEKVTEALDGDEQAVNGAMNIIKGAQDVDMQVSLGFRKVTRSLKEGISSMFHGLFDISGKALGAVGKFFSGIFNKGKEAGGNVAGGVKSIFGKIGEFGKTATKGFFRLFANKDESSSDTETSGSGSRLAGRASDVGEGDTVTRDGEQMVIVNGQEVRKEDYEQDKAFKKSIIQNLPFLSGFGKIFGKDGIFAKLFKKDEDEKKEKKSIFEMLFGSKDGKLGFLNGLFSFFTGKDIATTLGIGGALKAIGEGKGFIKGVLADAVPFAIGAAILTGLADPLGEIIGNLKIFNGDNQPDNAIDGAASNSATVIGGKQIAKDAFGNLKTDENGNLIAIDGSIVSKSAKVEGVYGEDNRLSSRVTRNIATTGIGYVARNGLGEVSSLTGLAKNTASAFTHNPVVGGMAKSASKVSTRVGNAWTKLTFKETTTATLKDGTKWVVGSGEKTFFGKGVEKLSGFARKCAEHTAKFFKGVGEALAKKFPKAAKVCEGLSQKFTEWFAENLGEETAKNTAGVLEKAAKVAYIAILVGAAINAIGNAPSYLQVTTPYRELPAGAILISVIVNVVNNAIPFVGGLIPTRVFFNFFNFAVKFAGLGDDKWFQDWEQKRAEAEAEVKAFNDETGYGFNIEEYNDYMHNNGVLTDIGNSYKAAAAELKNSGYEFGDITKGMAYGANQYISDKAKELGLDDGINSISDFSKALTIGSSMVGDIGHSMLTENLISKTLSDRIDANVEADRKNGKFNLYDSVMTGIGNGIVGMESGLQNAGNWVANKASGAWNGIKTGATNAWNGVKNFGANIGTGLNNFGDAVQTKVADIAGAVSNSAPIKHARDMVSQYSKTNELFLQAMKEGDLNKLLAAKESIKAGSETGDYTQFQASMSDIQYLLLWIPTALKSAGNKINSKFEEIKTKASVVTNKIGNIGNELFTPAFQGDISTVEKYEIPQDAANPLGKVVSGIANAIKLVAKPVAYACNSFNKVKEKFDNLKEKTRNSSEALKTGIRDLGTIMLSGDTEALDSYEYPDDGSPTSKASSVIFSILKQTVTPVTKVSHAFHVIKDKIQEGVDKSKEAYSSFKEIIPEMWDLAKSGELTKLDSYDYSRATDAPLAGHAFGVVLGTAKTVLTPIAMVTHVGAMIKNKVSDIVDNIKKGKEKYDQNMDSIANYALKGDLSSIWNGESNGGGARVGESTSTSSPLDWIWNIATFISKIFYSVIGVVNGIGTKVKDGFENVKEGVKGFFNSIGNFFDDWLGVDYVEGKGSGIAGKGSGSFVSQFDYKGMKMGSGESVADAGCGPAVAAMAARDAGIPLSMNSAVRASDSYQTSGGTDISYFGDTMGSMGISTRTMTDKNQIYSALGGRGAILLGQDASNTTKENSPFGPGAHYVYSPGTDRNGNIIVKDPESNRPRTYSPNILNNTIAAVGVGKGSFHSAPTIPTRNFNQKRLPNYSIRSGKSTNRPAEHARIYSWLITEAKLKDYQAAAVMGCWQAESGNTPRTIEGYYLKSFPGFEEVASRPALSNYCSGALFSAYANSGIGINRGAYQGGDGYYYPGMGLAQWTGPRGKKLLDYAENKKWNWYDLKTQLEFFMMEMTSNYSGLYSSLKGTGNLEDATEVFAAGYEHGGLRRGGSLESKYWDRVNAARGIFSTYANRPLADVSNLESSEYRGGSGGVDPREKMLDIARGEIGYHEGANNYNKYSNSNVAWCGSFVRWLYEQVSDNDPETYQKLTGVNINTQREWIPPIIPSSMRKYYKDGEVPQPGDLVAYANAGGNSVAHTGIVESVDPSSESFVGIDGNWGDAVSRTNRPYNGSVSMDQKVLWWARPNWKDAFPNGYFGSYDGSSSGSHGSSGSSGSSGNKLSDYLSGISTVFTKMFDKIFGRSDDEEESESSSGDYSSSYGDYSSGYGDYGSYGSYTSSAMTTVKDDQGDNWVWDRNKAIIGPKDRESAEAWEHATTLDEKIALLAKWNGRFIPKDLKMNATQATEMLKTEAGKTSYIDWYMSRSLPLHRPTGVYVIPNEYKRFNWKKGDAAKITPNMLGININSASDAKNWELAKKDPGRLFRLIAKYYDREYPNNIFPSGAEYEAFDKSPNAVFDWVDNALINNTIPGKDTRSKWINLAKSSDSDVAEYNRAFNTQGYLPSLNANDATNPYKNSSSSRYDPNLDNGDGTSFVAGSGSGLTEEKKKLQNAYNIKKLSGWGTTQGHSGTNRPSKSVYVGKGTNDTVNVAPVSVSSSNITPENLALLKVIVTLMKQLVDNTNQVNAIFEVLKTVAESSGVNNAALLSAIGNMSKATDTSVDPGLADLKSVFDSLLLA